MDIILQRFIIGFAVNLLFGMIAFTKEMIDDTGFFTGVILYTVLYVFMDWQAYVILVVFFMIVGFAINIENKDKSQKGSFELYKAKRSADRVLGRSLAGAIFAGLFFLTYRNEFKLAFVASYAQAIFDTVSTKLGKLLSKEAVLITNFKPVHRGTPGAISLKGTAMGALAALILALAGNVIGLIRFDELLIVIVSAFLGSTADSYLNAFSHKKTRIPNEVINFSSSLLAGLISICIALLFNI